MQKQGEVEDEYHAAHTYIQRLEDEISQVLDGFLTRSQSSAPWDSASPTHTLSPPSSNTHLYPHLTPAPLPHHPTKSLVDRTRYASEPVWEKSSLEGILSARPEAKVRAASAYYPKKISAHTSTLSNPDAFLHGSSMSQETKDHARKINTLCGGRTGLGDAANTHLAGHDASTLSDCTYLSTSRQQSDSWTPVSSGTTGTNPSLEDVTNTHLPEHKAKSLSGPGEGKASEHRAKTASGCKDQAQQKQPKRRPSFDAELYWTGRRISVEDSRPHKSQPEEDEKPKREHTFGGRRRRTSLGDNSEGYDEASDLVIMSASDFKLRRSSLGECSNKCRKAFKIGGTSGVSCQRSLEELKGDCVSVIVEEQSSKEFGRAQKEGLGEFQNERGDDGALCSSSANGRLDSGEVFVANSSAQTLKAATAEEDCRASCSARDREAKLCLANSKGPHNSAEISRRARELRNSITESISKAKCSDHGGGDGSGGGSYGGGVRRSVMSKQSVRKPDDTSRDLATLLCRKIRDPKEAFLNKDSGASLTTSQSATSRPLCQNTKEPEVCVKEAMPSAVVSPESSYQVPVVCQKQKDAEVDISKALVGPGSSPNKASTARGVASSLCCVQAEERDKAEGGNWKEKGEEKKEGEEKEGTGRRGCQMQTGYDHTDDHHHHHCLFHHHHRHHHHQHQSPAKKEEYKQQSAWSTLPSVPDIFQGHHHQHHPHPSKAVSLRAGWLGVLPDCVQCRAQDTATYNTEVLLPSGHSPAEVQQRCLSVRETGTSEGEKCSSKNPHLQNREPRQAKPKDLPPEELNPSPPLSPPPPPAPKRRRRSRRRNSPPLPSPPPSIQMSDSFCGDDSPEQIAQLCLLSTQQASQQWSMSVPDADTTEKTRSADAGDHSLAAAATAGWDSLSSEELVSCGVSDGDSSGSPADVWEAEIPSFRNNDVRESGYRDVSAYVWEEQLYVSDDMGDWEPQGTADDVWGEAGEDEEDEGSLPPSSPPPPPSPSSSLSSWHRDSQQQGDTQKSSGNPSMTGCHQRQGSQPPEHHHSHTVFSPLSGPDSASVFPLLACINPCISAPHGSSALGPGIADRLQESGGQESTATLEPTPLSHHGTLGHLADQTGPCAGWTPPQGESDPRGGRSGLRSQGEQSGVEIDMSRLEGRECRLSALSNTTTTDTIITFNEDVVDYDCNVGVNLGACAECSKDVPSCDAASIFMTGEVRETQISDLPSTCSESLQGVSVARAEGHRKDGERSSPQKLESEYQNAAGLRDLGEGARKNSQCSGPEMGEGGSGKSCQEGGDADPRRLKVWKEGEYGCPKFVRMKTDSETENLGSSRTQQPKDDAMPGALDPRLEEEIYPTAESVSLWDGEASGSKEGKREAGTSSNTSNDSDSGMKKENGADGSHSQDKSLEVVLEGEASPCSQDQSREVKTSEPGWDRENGPVTSHSLGGDDKIMGSGWRREETSANASSDARPQRDARRVLAESLQLDAVPAAIFSVHSRDAEVQTSPGSTLRPAHLLPHVDCACQTSPAVSSCEDLSQKEPSVSQSEHPSCQGLRWDPHAHQSVRPSVQLAQSVNPSAQSTEPFAQSTESYVQTTEPVALTTELFAQSEELSAQSTESFVQSTEPSKHMPAQFPEPSSCITSQQADSSSCLLAKETETPPLSSELQDPDIGTAPGETDQWSEGLSPYLGIWGGDGEKNHGEGSTSERQKRPTEKSGGIKGNRQQNRNSPWAGHWPAQCPDHTDDDSKAEHQSCSKMGDDATLSRQRRHVQESEGRESSEKSTQQELSQRCQQDMAQKPCRETTQLKKSLSAIKPKASKERVGEEKVGKKVSEEKVSKKVNEEVSKKVCEEKIGKEKVCEEKVGKQKFCEEMVGEEKICAEKLDSQELSEHVGKKVGKKVSKEKVGTENFSFLPDEEPEMQVMVNSLTPVLQRRRSTRRSNSHSGTIRGSSGSEDTTAAGTAEDLQNLLLTLASDEQHTTPSSSLSSALAHMEHHPAQSKKMGQGFSSHAALTDMGPGQVAREVNPDPSRGLFLKPQFARTWHGPLHTGRPWGAPRMGVAMMTSSEPSAGAGSGSSNARWLGVGVVGEGFPAYSGRGVMHGHTIPVISRTLLDALHKRYCSYQYAGWAPSFPYSLPPVSSDPQPLPQLLPQPSPAYGTPPRKKLSSEGNSEDTGSSSMGGGMTSGESSPPAAMHVRPHTSRQPQTPRDVQSTSRQAPRDICGSSMQTQLQVLQGKLGTASTVRPPCKNIPAASCAAAEAGALGGSGDGGHGDSAAGASSSKQHHMGYRTAQEIQAVEACEWLRATGFPQYAHMFDEGLFPVDIGDVHKDHLFLDKDSFESVIRRLNILNTCSVMKIDAQPTRKAPEDSDEEDQCALSSNWEYQKSIQRWSRKLDPEVPVTRDFNLIPRSSHDSLLGEDSGSHTDESPVLDSKMPHSTAALLPGGQTASDSALLQVETCLHSSSLERSGPVTESHQVSHVSSFPISPKLRRVASERLKSALKKMESFKKKPKKLPLTGRSIVEISDPVVSDQHSMQAKLQQLNCVDIVGGGVGGEGGGGSTHTTVPAPTPHLPPPHKVSTPVMDRHAYSGRPGEKSSSSVLSPGSRSGMDQSSVNSSTSSVPGDSSSLSEYYTAHSQLLATFQEAGQLRQASRKNSDSSLVEIFLLPQDHKPGSFPRMLKNGYIDTISPTFPAQSSSTNTAYSLHRGATFGGSVPLSSRISVYDNLSPGSPQHQQFDTSHSSRHSQVVRSLSMSSGPTLQDIEKPDMDLASIAGMVRSRSASATMSMEHQALSRTHRKSDGLDSFASAEDMAGRSIVSERKLSAGMQELDAMLENLYREINSLGSDLSSGGDEDDSSRDTPQAVVGISQSSSSSTITAVAGVGANDPHEVSLPTATQNGTGSVHWHAGSLTEEGQSLSLRTIPTEGEDSLDLTTPAEEVDDSLEGEEGDDGSSTQDSSEEIEGSADETLDRIILEAHERRDSGVGSSLTRASRERTRKKIRWESFQKSHRPSRASRELQIGGLSVCQLLPLRQLSLLKLTSIMEKYSPTNRSQWSWSVPRFMKRHRAPQFSDKNVFGVPFTVTLQRTGQPLPQCVLYAMRYLRKTSHDAIGIFRKSGVRSRIQKLRDMVEACPDTVNFDELQPYDVADLLKQYFRELPECLLTSKLSDTFRSIFSHVPGAQRLEALQTAVVLLPEENREVLHCLLLFLGDIAQHADKHQMNASNLAVCFAPSLFNFLGSHGTNSPKRQRRGLGVPEPKELMEQKAVHECFTYMITECKKLFMVPPSMYSRLHLSTLSNMEPVHLDEFYAKGKIPGPDYKAFGEEHIQFLLKEAHDKNRGWAPVSVSVAGIEVMQRKPQDGHPLRQWKCSVEIEAPPIEVLNRILHERHKWDDDMLSWNVVERMDRHCDVFHYVLNSMAPHPPRHFMVLRYWRPDLAKGACAMVSRSVEHSGWKGSLEADYDQGVRAVELDSYYLMEPCGSGRARVTFIARTDLRGRCPEWYNRVFGHMSANYLDRLRDSFRQDAEGPETKV